MKLEHLSAIEIGKLVNSRVLSPTEVVYYFLKRIEERNPSINAFVYTKPADALTEAHKLEKRILDGENVGPFAGVPVGLKDFLPSKKGWKNSHGGVRALIATDLADSAFYSAARSAGAVAVGKTNAPPFGFSGTCDNKLYGPTRNPFNTNMNSGGSSGGSASAVADGLCPICEGGDAGGSIRIPSAWCGCYGFKAGIGTVPSYCRPDGWAATHPYCFNGGITRTVEDSAMLLNYMAQYDPRDPLSLPIAAGKDFISLMKRDIKGMRIGLTYDFNLFPTIPEVRDAVTKIAKVLESLGAIVEPVDFHILYSLDEIQKTWCKSISVDTALDLQKWKSEGLDIEEICKDEIIPEFFEANKLASKMTIQDMRRFNDIRTAILDAHEDIFKDHDLILSPVAAVPAFPNSVQEFTYGPDYIMDKAVDRVIGFAETFLVNFVGYPAASVPAGFTKNGLPLGVQLIGKKYREEDVLSASWNIEQASPWSYEKAFSRM